MELPVYDSTGNRTPFRVVSVAPEQNPGINLLERVPELIRAEGTDIWFSSGKHVMGRPMIVEPRNHAGSDLSTTIYLSQCPQRHSLRVGVSETGLGDVSGETIRGRLTGCRFTGNWWVRAMPMFGEGEGPETVFEGYIHPNGEFSLSGGMHGERHILIFGSGRRPVFALGFDVVLAGENLLGVIDLSGKCTGTQEPRASPGPIRLPSSMSR